MRVRKKYILAKSLAMNAFGEIRMHFLFKQE